MSVFTTHPNYFVLLAAFVASKAFREMMATAPSRQLAQLDSLNAK